ncbi:heme utilization cystosolic carrier protein HutX [Edwardsiella ictaluri]|uniref:heme utilization cystosolic carrier protein HutX n=1 Tax=Edwardsiella ictaluri TaxID=67780 RepID=UPI003783CFD7
MHPKNLSRVAELDAFLSTAPMDTVEEIAQRFALSALDVLRRLPQVTLCGGDAFDRVWQTLTGWGDVTTLINNPDLILEFHGPLPGGARRHGFFNLRGEGGLSGHIRAQRCRHIALVERPFMGMETASVWFINPEGQAMLKVFVGRDEKRRLRTEPLMAFRTLAQTLATTEEYR